MSGSAAFLIVFLLLIGALVGTWFFMGKSGIWSGKTTYKVSIQINSDLKTLTQAQYDALPNNCFENSGIMYLGCVPLVQKPGVELVVDGKITLVVGMFGFPKTMVLNKENSYTDRVVLLGTNEAANISLTIGMFNDEKSSNGVLMSMDINNAPNNIKEFTLAQLQKFPDIVLYYYTENALDQKIWVSGTTIHNVEIPEKFIATYKDNSETSKDPELLVINLENNQ